MPEPDIKVWAFCGGYLIKQEVEGTRYRICLTREEVMAHVEALLKQLDDNGAGEAADRALRGK